MAELTGWQHETRLDPALVLHARVYRFGQVQLLTEAHPAYAHDHHSTSVGLGTRDMMDIDNAAWRRQPTDPEDLWLMATLHSHAYSLGLRIRACFQGTYEVLPFERITLQQGVVVAVCAGRTERMASHEALAQLQQPGALSAQLRKPDLTAAQEARLYARLMQQWGGTHQLSRQQWAFDQMARGMLTASPVMGHMPHMLAVGMLATLPPRPEELYNSSTTPSRRT